MLFFVALAAGALLSAVLALALLREVRLRRALQAILRRLLEPVSKPLHDDEEAC